MPQIRQITDLRNTNDISDVCHILLDAKETSASLREKHFTIVFLSVFGTIE